MPSCRDLAGPESSREQQLGTGAHGFRGLGQRQCTLITSWPASRGAAATADPFTTLIAATTAWVAPYRLACLGHPVLGYRAARASRHPAVRMVRCPPSWSGAGRRRAPRATPRPPHGGEHGWRGSPRPRMLNPWRHHPRGVSSMIDCPCAGMPDGGDWHEVPVHTVPSMPRTALLPARGCQPLCFRSHVPVCWRQCRGCPLPRTLTSRAARVLVPALQRQRICIPARGKTPVERRPPNLVRSLRGW